MKFAEIASKIEYHESQIKLLKEIRKAKEDIKVYEGMCVDTEKDPHYGSIAKKTHIEYYHKKIDSLRAKVQDLEKLLN